MAEGELLGKVTHYYDHISVAVLRLERGLKVGEAVHFFGRHTDFQQVISSMQVEHQAVEEGAAGTEVAVKVKQRVRTGDALYRLIQEAT
jgi:putative protease